MYSLKSTRKPVRKIPESLFLTRTWKSLVSTAILTTIGHKNHNFILTTLRWLRVLARNFIFK
jgi:hypothetical protein